MGRSLCCSRSDDSQILVEEIVPRHGVPQELLSDRGANFLSKLMAEVCRLLWVKKVNTSAYHPQSDCLVERLHRTLLDMLSKSTGDNKKAWDTKLPFILFAYRATQQDSTKSSPFQLLYRKEAELSTADILTPPPDRTLYPTDGYHDDIVGRMSSAWDIARSQIARAQCKQRSSTTRGLAVLAVPLLLETWSMFLCPLERLERSGS